MDLCRCADLGGERGLDPRVDSSRVGGQTRQWVKQHATSRSMIDRSYTRQTSDLHWSSILGVNLRLWGRTLALLPPPTRFRSASGRTGLFISPLSRWNSNVLDQGEADRRSDGDSLCGTRMTVLGKRVRGPV